MVTHLVRKGVEHRILWYGHCLPFAERRRLSEKRDSNVDLLSGKPPRGGAASGGGTVPVGMRWTTGAYSDRRVGGHNISAGFTLGSNPLPSLAS